MQGAFFLQKFEEIATFEQKKCLAVYRKRGRLFDVAVHFKAK